MWTEFNNIKNRELNSNRMQVDHFTLQTQIGEGTFCLAYEAIDTSKNDHKVCFKLFKDVPNSDMSFNKELIPAQKQFNHPNILKLIGGGTVPQEEPNKKVLNYLISELAEAGTIQDLVEKEGPLPENITRRLFSECLNAVDYVHSRECAHRDVKPENLLLVRNSKTFTVKLGDFGTCVELAGITNLTARVGTQNFMAPELWNDNYQGQSVDVFALGVTLWIMLVGQFPFEHSKDDFYKALVNQPEFYM
jgi:serine/threonine protein kinase